MSSTVRLATEEDRGLAVVLSKYVKDETMKKVASIGEEKFGLRVIFIKGNKNSIPVLMPSGQVLVRDYLETSATLDVSLAQSEYKGDRSPNGDLANAVTYSGVIRDTYLKMQGVTL